MTGRVRDRGRGRVVAALAVTTVVATLAFASVPVRGAGGGGEDSSERRKGQGWSAGAISELLQRQGTIVRRDGDAIVERVRVPESLHGPATRVGCSASGCSGAIHPVPYATGSWPTAEGSPPRSGGRPAVGGRDHRRRRRPDRQAERGVRWASARPRARPPSRVDPAPGRSWATPGPYDVVAAPTTSAIARSVRRGCAARWSSAPTYITPPGFPTVRIRSWCSFTGTTPPASGEPLRLPLAMPPRLEAHPEP